MGFRRGRKASSSFKQRKSVSSVLNHESVRRVAYLTWRGTGPLHAKKLFVVLRDIDSQHSILEYCKRAKDYSNGCAKISFEGLSAIRSVDVESSFGFAFRTDNGQFQFDCDDHFVNESWLSDLRRIKSRQNKNVDIIRPLELLSDGSSGSVLSVHSESPSSFPRNLNVSVPVDDETGEEGSKLRSQSDNFWSRKAKEKLNRTKTAPQKIEPSTQDDEGSVWAFLGVESPRSGSRNEIAISESPTEQPPEDQITSATSHDINDRRRGWRECLTCPSDTKDSLFVCSICQKQCHADHSFGPINYSDSRQCSCVALSEAGNNHCRVLECSELTPVVEELPTSTPVRLLTLEDRVNSLRSKSVGFTLSRSKIESDDEYVRLRYQTLTPLRSKNTMHSGTSVKIPNKKILKRIQDHLVERLSQASQSSMDSTNTGRSDMSSSGRTSLTTEELPILQQAESLGYGSPDARAAILRIRRRGQTVSIGSVLDLLPAPAPKETSSRSMRDSGRFRSRSAAPKLSISRKQVRVSEPASPAETCDPPSRRNSNSESDVSTIYGEDYARHSGRADTSRKDVPDSLASLVPTSASGVDLVDLVSERTSDDTRMSETTAEDTTRSSPAYEEEPSYSFSVTVEERKEAPISPSVSLSLPKKVHRSESCRNHDAQTSTSSSLIRPSNRAHSYSGCYQPLTDRTLARSDRTETSSAHVQPQSDRAERSADHVQLRESSTSDSSTVYGDSMIDEGAPDSLSRHFGHYEVESASNAVASSKIRSEPRSRRATLSRPTASSSRAEPDSKATNEDSPERSDSISSADSSRSIRRSCVSDRVSPVSTGDNGHLLRFGFSPLETPRRGGGIGELNRRSPVSGSNRHAGHTRSLSVGGIHHTTLPFVLSSTRSSDIRREHNQTSLRSDPVSPHDPRRTPPFWFARSRRTSVQSSYLSDTAVPDEQQSAHRRSFIESSSSSNIRVRNSPTNSTALSRFLRCDNEQLSQCSEPARNISRLEPAGMISQAAESDSRHAGESILDIIGLRTTSNSSLPEQDPNRTRPLSEKLLDLGIDSSLVDECRELETKLARYAGLSDF